ncbi:MAG TPA: hypothetical protein VFD58_31945 [Blastocatellia bacterium]|nr:hypothetical protein [Blastocatellia bacterium]
MSKEKTALPDQNEQPTVVAVIPAQEQAQPQKWYQVILMWFLSAVSVNPLAALLAVALLVAIASLGAWVITLHLENRVLFARLKQQMNAEGPPELQSRIAAAQQQMSEIKGQIDQQQTEQALNDKESLVAENARLLAELDDLSKPHVNLPVIELNPASASAAPDNQNPAGQTGAGEEQVNAKPAPRAKGSAEAKEIVQSVEVPPTATLFTVILRKSLEKPYPNYLLELLDRKSNKVIWSGQQKKPAETNLSLTLARRNYPAGKYRIRLSGLNGKKKEAADTWDVQVHYQEEAPKGKKKR